MLGLLPEDDARARLDAIRRPAVTPHTVVDVDRLIEQLQRGRELGRYEAQDEHAWRDGAGRVALAGRPTGRAVAGRAGRPHREEPGNVPVGAARSQPGAAGRELNHK
ncbi:hypothetical protein ACU4GD_20325 [Cupriavidus basilensis]